MKEKLGNLLKVSRGLHILEEEKNIKNLENKDVSKAYALTYNDFLDYTYSQKDTLNIQYDKKSEIFVNLNKRYKNSRVQNYDIVLSQQSFYNRPRLVYKEDILEHNLIYDNSIIFIRLNSDKINIKFAFYVMNTQRVKDIINATTVGQASKKITCSTIKNIEMELPSLEVQKKTVEKLEEYNSKLEKLIF